MTVRGARVAQIVCCSVMFALAGLVPSLWPVATVCAQEQPAAPPAAQPAPAQQPPAEAAPPDAAQPAEAQPPAETKPAGAEAARMLKFSFRFQPWADVLEWFAEQADLSLVLDAPPPGTFNYSDSREYTVPEAIDLINSVLLTKGYTLVRRERMLMLVDLADGLPTDLLPRVTTDDLDKHGKNELVSVVIPLEGRDATEVEAEIKPLMGPYGKSASLPKTGQLLVTEMAGKMKLIAGLIKSMPIPKAPQPPAPPGSPVVPVLAAYPLESLDAKAILETIKALYPDAKVVIDEKGKRLLTSAVPEQQAGIEKAIGQLKTGAADAELPRLESYPVKQTFRSELSQILHTIVPEASFQFDSATGNLLVFGTPTQQAAVGQTLEQLGRRAPAGAERRIEIYPLQRSDPSAILTLLQKIMPDAQLTIDSPSKSIVAFGDDGEQQTVKETIERLEQQPVDTDRQEVKVYALTGNEPSTMSTILATLLPRVQMTLDTAHKQLVAVAQPHDHQRLQAVLEQLSTASGEPLELKVYPVRATTLATLPSLLTQTVPTAQVTVDTAGKRVVVLARAKEHEQIAATLAKIEEGAASEEPKLVVYPLNVSQSKKLQAVLTALAADLVGLRSVADPETGSMSVWATPAQHEQVRAIMEQVTQAPPEKDALVAEVYSVAEMDAATLLQLLQAAAPDARLMANTKANTVIAWARADQHAALREALQQIEKAPTAEGQRTAKVYRFRTADANAALTVLRTLVPYAQLAVDVRTGSLAATALPSEHKLIEQTVVELEGEGTAAEQFELKVYPVGDQDPATVLAIARDLFAQRPEVRLSLNTARKQLVAVAQPHDHQRLQGVLEQLSTASGEPLELKVYPVRATTLATLPSLLTQTVPTAQVTVDTAGKRVVVLARAKEHEQIAATLAKIEEGAASEEPKLVVYPLNVSQSKKLQAVLTALAADLVGLRSVADPETGSMSVWATPAQHEQVRAIMEQVTQELPEGQQARIVVYPIPDADPVALASMLQAVAPGARFSGDRQNASLAVWGTPAEHELLKPAIDAMLKRYPPGREPTLAVYRVDRAEIANLLTVLRGIVPQAQITGDTKNGNLVAWGTVEEHSKIRSTLEGLSKTAPEDALVAEVYSVAEMDAATLLQLLQAAAPEARLMANTKANTVIAWARADQHAALREALQQIEKAPSAEGQRTAKVYRFRTADANAALTVLRTLVPYAQLAVDVRTGSLAATALPSEHKLIEQTVVELEGEGAAAEQFELKVYPVGDQDPSTVLAIVRDLFAQRPEVRLSIEAKSGKLVAWAPKAQHETIRSVLAGMEEGDRDRDERQVQTYRLEDTDPAAVTSVLSNLFGNRLDVRIAPDQAGRTLTVVAPADVQAKVAATVQQMQGEAGEFDVIPLHVVDPFSAAASIRQLFGDPTDSKTPGAPRVEADNDAQQIVVRGTKQQLARIRELLTKMGEPTISSSLASGPGRKLRVIPLGGRAARAALDEMQRVWPQLRANPIRVVTPSAVVPTMKEGNSQPAKEGDKSPPAPPPAEKGQGEAAPPPAPAEEAKKATGKITPAPRTELLLALAAEEPPAEPPEPPAEPRAKPEEPAKNPPPAEAAGDQQPTVEPAAEPAAEPAPIIVATGDDSITIASEDLEALNQFEELLKVISQRYAQGGREFTVFNLKRANVMVVADTLNRLFEGGSLTMRTGGVTVVPDQRLNALVVQANRNDLATIEGLVEVLDTEDAAENLATRKPRVIALENASAVEVAEVIRDTYKTQLSASSARRQVPTPRGVSRELAVVIDELNSAATGPEMTLSVDTATNSLIVLAASPLFEEVKVLVESLDESAGSGTRTVRVVPLLKTNSKTMQQALKVLFETRPRRPGGSN